jgi:hypothetical protein
MTDGRGRAWEDVVLGKLIPEGWVGQYVQLELGTNEPLRLAARLDKVTDGGVVALVKVAVPNPGSKGRWGSPSYTTKFGARCYPWHSVHSIRLLEPEEKSSLEEEGWPPEKDATAQ